MLLCICGCLYQCHKKQKLEKENAPRNAPLLNTNQNEFKPQEPIFIANENPMVENTPGIIEPSAPTLSEV